MYNQEIYSLVKKTKKYWILIIIKIINIMVMIHDHGYYLISSVYPKKIIFLLIIGFYQVQLLDTDWCLSGIFPYN